MASSAVQHGVVAAIATLVDFLPGFIGIKPHVIYRFELINRAFLPAKTHRIGRLLQCSLRNAAVGSSSGRALVEMTRNGYA
ncbi:MAG TPA: hypothetical protein VGO80_16830 [Solirubrobacteraceae bacterium]|nr:hypothetical protein [Solirubrobacteraceae bacterium]